MSTDAASQRNRDEDGKYAPTRIATTAPTNAKNIGLPADVVAREPENKVTRIESPTYTDYCKARAVGATTFIDLRPATAAQVKRAFRNGRVARLSADYCTVALEMS